MNGCVGAVKKKKKVRTNALNICLQQHEKSTHLCGPQVHSRRGAHQVGLNTHRQSQLPYKWDGAQGKIMDILIKPSYMLTFMCNIEGLWLFKHHSDMWSERSNFLVNAIYNLNLQSELTQTVLELSSMIQGVTYY